MILKKGSCYRIRSGTSLSFYDAVMLSHSSATGKLNKKIKRKMVVPNGDSETILVGRTTGKASIKATDNGLGHLILDSESDTFVGINYGDVIE